MPFYFTQGMVVGRNLLPDLLKTDGATGRAVEVGTHRGDYAARILDRWGGHLTCVDPWENPPGYENQAAFLDGNGLDRQNDFEIACSRLMIYGDRVTLLRSTSLKASNEFKAESLDMVYIDGDHTESAVKSDLAAWWPKVRKGGLLAGHDVIMPHAKPEENWGIGIQNAIRHFAGSRGLVCYLVVEDCGPPWSYYFLKE